MALARVADVARYGAVQVEDQQVIGFAEKGQSGPGYINAGVYRMTRELVAAFPGEANFSFEARVLEPLVQCGSVAAYTRTSAFIDIGVPEDYARAQVELAMAGNLA
jgi:D-glycero-alpha-D-manno-heptose 1-phosphate guanylyltransferase